MRTLQRGYISSVVQVQGVPLQGWPEKPLRAFQPWKIFLLIKSSSFLITTVIWTCMRRRGKFRAYHDRTTGWRRLMVLISRLCLRKSVWCMMRPYSHPRSIIRQSEMGCFGTQISLKQEPVRPCYSTFLYRFMNGRPSGKSFCEGNYGGQSAGLWNMGYSPPAGRKMLWWSRLWYVARPRKLQMPALNSRTTVCPWRVSKRPSWTSLAALLIFHLKKKPMTRGDFSRHDEITIRAKRNISAREERFTDYCTQCHKI